MFILFLPDVKPQLPPGNCDVFPFLSVWSLLFSRHPFEWALPKWDKQVTACVALSLQMSSQLQLTNQLCLATCHLITLHARVNAPPNWASEQTVCFYWPLLVARMDRIIWLLSPSRGCILCLLNWWYALRQGQLSIVNQLQLDSTLILLYFCYSSLNRLLLSLVTFGLFWSKFPAVSILSPPYCVLLTIHLSTTCPFRPCLNCKLVSLLSSPSSVQNSFIHPIASLFCHLLCSRGTD